MSQTDLLDRPRRLPWVVLAISIAVILLARVRLYSAPLQGDDCAYALIGHELLHGRNLYSDLWERKPPLLYLTFAAGELIVGYGRQSVFLVGAAAALATLAGVWRAGRIAGRSAGIAAVIGWALVAADLGTRANEPDPEVFITAWMVWAFALLVNWPASRSLRRAGGVGLLMAAATLYKHNAALAAGALWFGHVVTAGRFRRGAAVAEAIVAAAAAGAVWGGVFVYFAAVGRVGPMVDVLFSQNLAYSDAGGGVVQNLIAGLSPGRLAPAWIAGAVWPVVVLLGVLWVDRIGRGAIARNWKLLVFWAIGMWMTISLTGMLYPHYYQLWLAPACVGGGWAAGGLLDRRTFRIPTAAKIGVVIAAGLCVAGRQAMQFDLTPQQWVRRQFPDFDFADQNRLGVDLGNLLGPNETFWELGEDNALYFFARRDPPSGLLFIDPLIYGDTTDAYWRRLMADLHRTRPDLVIVADAWVGLIPKNASVFPWIAANYVFTTAGPPHRGYRFYVRLGSPLAQRLGSSRPTADAVQTDRRSLAGLPRVL
jgi:hypothetical protein